MIINYNEDNRVKESVLTLGNFDGVHNGHKFLISKMNDIANNLNLKSVLITFNPHTRFITDFDDKESFRIITDSKYKIDLLKELNIDYISVVEFDLEISKIDYRDFIDQIVSKYNPKVLLLGYDNKFGYKGMGNYESVKSYISDKSYSMKVELVDRYLDDKQKTKSSIIKKYILDGNIKQANHSLGRTFKISGSIVKGYELGNTLGFPTANLHLENKQQIIPKVGVYYVNFRVGINNYKSLCNIGYSPTFKKDKKLSIETHILNEKNIDLYGEYAEIEFIDFIREEEEFSSKELLINQINKDISLINKIN